MADVEHVIIVGSGPAGYTAALYTSRANLNPLVIEGFLWGGLLQQTTDVENYPGYPEGIMGPELMQQFRDQAERFGTRFITDNVDEDRARRPAASRTPSGSTTRSTRPARSSSRWAPSTRSSRVPGEEELGGRGVSYCATCDAAFYKDKTTVIVGGGDSAMEEAIFLAKFSSQVTIVHRRDEFRASKIMLERARTTENIEFLTPYVVEEFVAGENGVLGHARLRNTETGEQRELPISGAFIAIGHEPQSELVAGHRRHRRERLRRSPRASRRARRCRACSPPATSSTTPTARRSPPPAPAVRPRSTPSGTCATTPDVPTPESLKDTGDLAEAQWAPRSDRAGAGLATG